MKSLRKLFLAVLNVLILTFAILQTIFVMMYDHDLYNYKRCYKYSGKAIFVFSALLIMSLIGLMASCCKSRSLQTFYVWLMIMSTIVVIIFSIVVFLTLPHESANATYQKTQNGNWLNGFSPMLRSALVKDWFTAKTCLVDKEICQGFENHPTTSPFDYLYYLQLGCCTPPKRCGFLPRNGTFWEIPNSGFASQDDECQMWANSKNDGGCYDCDSCKAGYLAKYQTDWQAYKAVTVAIFLILIINTSLAFWTFDYSDESEHAREQRKYRNIVNS
ncbi:hypothetical protein ACH5RR_011328 [Cinchona calisaya]|uniref:Uncharacterized protein n=1 Tax=Cinchona calisaya TaxID=153742 RepID=A0ABD3A758_9GENT